jgi:hypothetical protein
MALGEEDWLHLGEPLRVADGLVARLCMSIDPDTGSVDGPYVLIGGTEYTLSQAQQLAASLTGLAGMGAGFSPVEAGGMRSRGPSL